MQDRSALTHFKEKMLIVKQCSIRYIELRGQGKSNQICLSEFDYNMGAL